MEYTYTFCVIEPSNDRIISKNCKTLDTTTRLEEIFSKHVTFPYLIEVFSNSTMKHVKFIHNPQDLEDWKESRRIALERAVVWKTSDFSKITESTPNKMNNIQPAHYKNFIDEYQWIDAISRIPRYSDPNLFIAAVELQIRKYLDRNGRKDETLQELSKGLFYYIYMVMYIKNNNKPILAKDVHEIMNEIDKKVQHENHI